jgi:hypothetical protein
MAGLDPAIQQTWKSRIVALDGRVKPGHDN